MAALSGQRGLLVGATSLHAPGLAQALRAAGADLTVAGPTPAALSQYAAPTLACGTNARDIAEAIATLERDGRAIDFLVIAPAPILEAPTGADPSALTAAFATVVETASSWTSAMLPLMSARGAGVIVHVTGPSGLGGWPGWEAAGAAFAAVHNLVQSVAVGTAVAKVRVNALVPGLTEAQAQRVAAVIGQPLDTVRRRIPAGTFLPERALGDALLYLLHPSSSYVSGEILTVDGGWSMWGRLHAVAS